MADDKSYKVVFHEDSDDAPLRFWVPGSPVQLVATQVFRSTATSKAYLQLKVRNIATTALDRFSWGAEIELEDGTSDHVSGDEIDLALAPRAERTFGPVELPHGLVTSVSVRIGSARLTDDTAWKLPDPAPNPLVLQELGLSVDAMEERNRKLREAGVARPERLRYRHVDSGGWWACSCGAANLANDRCASCGVAHDELASLEDEDALAEITRRRRENRQARARKAGHAAKKVVPTVTITVVACVTVSMLWANVISPAWEAHQEEVRQQQAYGAAISELDAGDYLDAATQLETLGDYQDARNKAREAREALAQSYEDSGDYENAADQWQIIGNDSKAREAKYAYVQAHEDASDGKTYDYLRQLANSGYKDAEEILHRLFDPQVSFEVTTYGDIVDRGWYSLGRNEDWMRSSHILAMTYEGGGSPWSGYSFIVTEPAGNVIRYDQSWKVHPQEGTYDTLLDGYVNNSERAISDDKNVYLLTIPAVSSDNYNTDQALVVTLTDGINTDKVVYQTTYHIDGDGNISMP